MVFKYFLNSKYLLSMPTLYIKCSLNGYSNDKKRTSSSEFTDQELDETAR